MAISRSPKRIAVLVAATMVVGGLAACSSGSSSPSGSVASGTNAAPQSGGTLHVIAATGPDHMDPVAAYRNVDYELERLYARQLVSYPTVPYTSTSDSGWQQDVTPVADAATKVPTAANGGITDGGKVYTFHIKPGVRWDTTPARQVTAQDFVREFKAFFNPVSPVGNPAYYTSTIAGLTQYSNEETAFFANAKKEPPTAANIAAFQRSHNISGIKAVNSSTLQFTLTQPASDFIYMLAMPFASARPVEYDSYVPDSIQLDQHLISDGPYSVSSYVAGKSITLTRNPAWKQSTDTLRHQYVKSVALTMGVNSAQTQLSDIQAGSQDMTSDTPVNPASIESLAASHASNFVIWPGSMLNYVVINLRSPNNGGAMGKLGVRQALEYGMGKTAAIKAQGGPLVASPLNGVIPPGNAGYLPANLYPDNNGAGNDTACKNALTKAGFPHGITLNNPYPNDSTATRLFQAVQASFAKCGITLKGTPVPGRSFGIDLGNAPENNKPGTWDVAETGWIPDWYGNNGRTIVQALFQSPCTVNTVNSGCYNSPVVNSLVTKAEAASSVAAAATYWQQANTQIMKDAAIVPFSSQNNPVISSKRVRGVLPDGKSSPTAIYSPTMGVPDLSDVWLASS